MICVTIPEMVVRVMRSSRCLPRCNSSLTPNGASKREDHKRLAAITFFFVAKVIAARKAIFFDCDLHTENLGQVTPESHSENAFHSLTRSVSAYIHER